MIALPVPRLSGSRSGILRLESELHLSVRHLSVEQAAGKQGVHAGQVGQEEAGEQRHLFLTAGHLGIVRLWDSRSSVF